MSRCRTGRTRVRPGCDRGQDWTILNNIEFLHNISEVFRKFLKILRHFRTCHLLLLLLSTFAKFRQNFIKIWLRNNNFDEKLENFGSIQYSISQKVFTIFDQKIEFGAVQKYVNLVDLEKCCKMSIYLQNLASIQPRTSLSKFGGWFNSIFNPLLNPHLTV